MAATAKRIGVLTGGGDSSGIHAFLWRLHQTLQESGATLIGFERGWWGVAHGKWHEIQKSELRPLIFQSGTILGTSRTNPMKEGSMPQVLDTLAAAKIDILIAAGGDDTLSVAAELSRQGFPAIGVPQTIDNDVIGSETSIGFPTAVQRGVDMVTSCIPSNWAHRRDMVVEAMGREAGWLALHIALATFADVLLLPELPFDLEAVADEVRRRVSAGQHSVLVVASEGVQVESARRIARSVDAFGNVPLEGVGYTLAELLAKETGRELRVQVLGYAQRGGPPTERELWQDNLFAQRAAQLALEGRGGLMVGIQHDQVVEVPLQEVSKGGRPVTREWLEKAASLGLLKLAHAGRAAH